MLVKYYLSDNIKVTFEDFALGLWNAWAGLAWAFDIVLALNKSSPTRHQEKFVLLQLDFKKKAIYSMLLIFEFWLILLWVLTGNSKVQLTQYFEVNNLKKEKKKIVYVPKKKLTMTCKVVRKKMVTY